MKTNDKVGRFFRDVKEKVKGKQKADFDKIYESGNFPLLKHFLEEHNLIHFMRDGKGNTVLHLMAGHQIPKNLVPLINEGLNVNAINDQGESPLHLASKTRCLSNVKLLVREDCKLETKDHIGNTALHMAAAHGRINIVNYLIKAWLNIQDKNKNGETPLDLAIKYEHYELAAEYSPKTA